MAAEHSDTPHDPLDLRELMRSQKSLVARALVRAGVAERDVPDLIQEVFIVAHRRLPEWQGRAKLSTWFYRVALRVASDHRRRACQRREILLSLDSPTLEGLSGELHALDRHEQHSQLWAALEQLSEEHKQALVGYELEELSVAEIAARACIPQKTVYSRLAAARRLLRQLLQAQGWAWLLFLLRLPRRCLAAFSKQAVLTYAPLVGCLWLLAPALPAPPASTAAVPPALHVAVAALDLPPSQPLRAARLVQPSAAAAPKSRRAAKLRAPKTAAAQATTRPKPELKVVYAGSVERPEGELPFGFERVPDRTPPRIALRGPRAASAGILDELTF